MSPISSLPAVASYFAIMGVVLVVAGESMAALFMAICVAAVAHDKFRSRA